MVYDIVSGLLEKMAEDKESMDLTATVIVIWWDKNGEKKRSNQTQSAAPALVNGLAKLVDLVGRLGLQQLVYIDSESSLNTNWAGRDNTLYNYPLVNWHKYGTSPFLVRKLTISMAMF